MEQFLSTFVFILPGIMAYFWLQVFGMTPSVKHTAPELSGISALLWLPVSFITLLVLNTWGVLVKTGLLSVSQVWSVKSLNEATSDIKYLVLFLFVSFVVSFFVCWIWSFWGNVLLKKVINHVRKTRGVAALSTSSTVWEEFFVKLEQGNSEDADDSVIAKEAVYIVHKIDKPDEFIAGSMTKASSPLEVDKSLVLEDTQNWMDSINNDYDFDVKRIYIDFKSGMVVKEIDHKNPKEKPIPDN